MKKLPKKLMNDLIAIGRCAGLSEDEVATRLTAITINFNRPSVGDPFLKVLKQKGSVKINTKSVDHS